MRYGKNPHELRDTFRTRWHKSGADSLAAEFFMGHVVDPLGYNKAMEDIDYTRREYRKAERWLNVLSEDPSKVDAGEVEDLQAKIRELEAHDAEMRNNQTRMASIEAQLNTIQQIFTTQEITILQNKVADGTTKSLEEKGMLQPLKDLAGERLPEVLSGKYYPRKPKEIRCRVSRGGCLEVIAWNHGFGYESRDEVDQIMNNLSDYGLEAKTEKEENLNDQGHHQ
ncbi:MAG: hypothetical protein ABSA11_08215 [Candidatus Bathyarchaeia archaeon]